MSLSNEQLATLTQRIEERLAEFGNLSKSMPKFTPGIVRLVADVFDQWRSESATSQVAPASNNHAPMLNGNGKHKDPEPAEYAEYEAYDDPHEELVQWRPVTPSPQAVATLGPEHVIVTPLKPKLPDPDIARDRLAGALANGSDGELVSVINRQLRGRRGNVLPTLDQVIAELQHQAMGGVMPTMTAFDAAKPGNWASAQAQMARLGTKWNELAEAAGLKPNLRG